MECFAQMPQSCAYWLQVDSTEYPLKISSWQANNELIIFNGFPAKIPSRPFVCSVGLKHLSWFDWLLITGPELFLATKKTDCPDGGSNKYTTDVLSESPSYFLHPCHSLHIHHPEKKSKGVFHQITKTHGTVICVSTGVVLLLLIVSILVQVKQPRKKVIKTSHDKMIWYHGV